MLNLSDRSRYEGDFLYFGRVVPYGHGVYLWTDGRRYEGGFRDGVSHGLGILTYPGGARYEGAFVGGNPHGYGVLADRGAVVYEGQWVDGRPVADDRGRATEAIGRAV